MDFPWLAIGTLGTAGIAGAVALTTGRYALAATAGAGIILWLHGPLYFHYTSDDAYISYRYARNFAEGLGLVWNPGEYVEGYSNFLWVVILGGLHKAGADIVMSGRWLGFALGVVAAAGAFRLSRDLLDGEAGKLAGLVAALLLAASAPFALWTSAGLETGLFAVLVLGAVLLHVREDAGLWPPASGALWALASMTRPDGVLLFAVAGVFKLGVLVAAARPGRGERDGAPGALEALGWLAIWAAGFAAVFAPYFAWRYVTYDWFFPNTFYAKVGHGLDQYQRGLRYFGSFAREYAAWLLLLAPLAMALSQVRRLRAGLVLALLVVWGAYIVYIGGDSLVRFRFFAPIMPLFYALVAASGAALVQAVRLERPPPRYAAGIAGALAVGGLLAFTLFSSLAGETGTGLRVERRTVSDRVEVGRWLRANLPDTTVIAVLAAGALPYESRLDTIDMLGISDEHIAHREVDLGRLAAGHEKYDGEYVLDRSPDIIILFDGLSDSPRARADYGVLQAVIIPAAVDLVGRERLWEEYEPRSVEVREGEWFNLLVRRDASPVLAKTQSAGPAPE